MKEKNLGRPKKRIRTKEIIAIFIVISFLSGIALAVESNNSSIQGNTVTAQGITKEKIKGPFSVGKPVKPVKLKIDLRKLPVASPWRPGQPMKVAPGQSGNGEVESGGNNGVSNTEASSGRVSIPPANADSLSTLADPLSSPIINIDGIVNTGIIPPDTNGAVGPNHYIQTVNARFAIFNKSGGVLVGQSGSVVGGININSLWISAGLNNNCSIRNDGDPVVKYDAIADRWVITQFVAFTDFCIAVSQTPDPIAGGWFLYNFSSNGIANDYPKFGVWPDAYYAGTNNNAGGGNAWAFDRTNMLAGNVANAPIQFSLGGRFMLPSDLDGTVPPAGAPNVFVRFAGGNHLELREFHVDFANPGLSTFTALPDIPVNAFSNTFCGATGFRVACIDQPGTTQRLDVLNGEMMYRLQYRNFGSYETLVTNHDINVGNNQSANRWYELHKSAGTWSLFQQGTNNPDTTNRWMGSIAMDKFGDLALAYSVSSSANNVFPGLRYTGRVPADPIGTLEAESTLIAGNGSQTGNCGNDCGNRWGDYSSMSVDPSDDCTFWYTSEYYPSSSAANWRTRIGSFRYCSSVSGEKFNDLNGNGVKDGGEPGLPNWQISLIDSNNNVVATTLTGSGGSYSFTGINQGTYTVKETLQPGWIQTAPASPGTYSVTINGGNAVVGIDFGNFKLGEVHGQKFEDLNANGVKDANETGLAGWNITINGTDTITGTPVNITTTTDANGNYSFTNLTAGTYIISEKLKDGWFQTAPASRTYTVIINSGTVITGKDFGNKQFSIFGMKFNDRNGNKKRDPGEEGLAGWHIRLVGTDTLTNTGVNREEITDANGNYGFKNVNPGIYQVFELIDASKAGWVPTTPPTVPINLKVNESINVNFGNKKIP